MDASPPAKALIAAVVVASAALGATLSTSAALKQRARSASHQQPMAETLFEPHAPASAELTAHGRKLFLGSCAHCHGADARGDEGPDLHDVQVSDRYIRNIVLHGIPHEMPSFAKKHNDADIVALIAYVRSLE
jgi:mono/diheme cytochrome c family protein